MAEPQWVEGHELAAPAPETAPLWVEGHELQAPAAPPQPAAPTLGESRARGGLQGLTAGYGDELSAGLAAALPFLDREAAQGSTFGERYQHARDFYRGLNDAAQKANPKNYLAGELGGSVLASVSPVGQLLNPGKGATLATTLLKTGGQGALMGLGASNADLTRGQFGQAAIDTAAGAGTGMLLGYGARRLGGFGQKAGQEVRMANADAAEAAALKAGKADQKATGAYGGDVASVLDAARSYEHALTSPLATAEQKAAAQAALSDPAFQQVYQDALQGKLELGAQKLHGRLLNSRAAMETAQAANTPEAIERAAAESMANPWRRQVLPRLYNYAERFAMPVLGHHFGGIPGAIAGGVAGAVMGKPGTAFANMVKNPGVRAAMWGALEKGANVLTPMAQHSAAAGSLTLSPDIAAMVSALRAKQAEPDYSNWTEAAQ